MRFKLLYFLLITIGLQAQNSKKVKWGKVTQSEINTNNVSFEEDANAVILYESGDMTVQWPKSIMTVYKRIKILSKEGLDEANQELVYYAENKLDQISNIKAQTINIENGETKISEVGKEDIFTVDINELYKAKRFTFPNVKVGSIIEFKYRFSTERFFYLEGWEFQHHIPTLKSDFKIDINMNFNYTILYFGNQLVAKYRDTHKKNSDGTVSLSNIPSIKDIDFVYSIDDNIEKIDFQLKENGYTGDTPYKNWTELVKETNADLKDKKSKGIVKDIAEQIPNGNSDYETLENVCLYMKQNFSYDGFFSRFPSKTNRDIIKSKKGNTAELNHLLNTILEVKGIKTKMVLLGTRKFGKIKTSYPYMGQFNKLINLVELNDGTNHLIDATSINSNNLLLMPKANYNYFALVLNDKKEQWIRINQPSSKLISIQSYSVGKKIIKYSNRYQHDGFFIQNKDEFRNRLKPAIRLNYELVNEDRNKDNVKFRKYKGTSKVVNNEDFYVIENPIISYLEKYQFNKEQRNYNVEFNFKKEIGTHIKVKIPDNYNYSIPDSFNQTLKAVDDNFFYQQNAEIKDGKLMVKYEFVLGELKVEPKNYKELKAFFDKVQSIAKEQILIKKE